MNVISIDRVSLPAFEGSERLKKNLQVRGTNRILRFALTL
jgi:hypothetical protein